MDHIQTDFMWPNSEDDPGPRTVRVHDRLRYAKGVSQSDPIIDGGLNYHWLMSPASLHLPRIMLEAGINAPAGVSSEGVVRTPLVALRSSPWKAGHESNPWHDVFDLDHGRVRYFGDHKPATVGPIGATAGNRSLIAAHELHEGTSAAVRLLAPPLLLFRSIPMIVEGKTIPKGQVEFCGTAIIERLEYVVQRDPASGVSFPNLAVDLAVVTADENDEIDLRWIDARRHPALSAAQAHELAPSSWKRWVKDGKQAISGVRRRVLASKVLSKIAQLPDPGSTEAALLTQIYSRFDNNKHAFELLSSWVAGDILNGSSGSYKSGWLSKSGGDGGLDFVGRIDLGSTSANTPVVVLGQAKCIMPTSSVSPDQVARLVARLRRGWIGVFVTTGTFSQHAQIEIIDDQYPVVLVHGRTLASVVYRLAQADCDGDVGAFLDRAIAEYGEAVDHRRPEEVINL